MDPITAVKTISTVGDVIVAARDGIDGYNSTKPGKANSNSLRTYSYSSAASAASKLIAVFPILTSRTVSTETAQMVSKYIEQKGCIILQLALQAANISNAKNGMDYLRNFHQNLNVGGSGVDALTKTLDLWVNGFDQNSINAANQRDLQHGGAYHQESFSSIMAENMREVDDSEVYESDNSVTISAQQMRELLEMFRDAENIQVYDTKLNPVSIDDYMITETYNGDYHVTIQRYPVNEAKRQRDVVAKGVRDARNYANSMDEYERREAERVQKDKELSDRIKRDKEIRSEYERRRKAQQDYEERQAKLDKANRDNKEHEEDRNYTLSQRKRNDDEHKEDRAYSLAQRKRSEDERLNKSVRSHNVEILKDQDIKKMNNAVPSLLVVRFYNDSSASVSTEFIIGVKAKILGVNSDEILRRIANDNADGKWFLNLMRTMTGELRASDFLFGLSRTDEDLRALRKKGSQGDTWALLQSRALAAKEAVKQGRLNNFAAITTVLVSQEDCDELFREENLDMTNPSVAKHFMSSYNLLGFIIADDSTESLKIMFDDGDNYFEELSYRMLERETSDGTYKKLINLITSSR